MTVALPQLHGKFVPPEAYRPSGSYRLLPFDFTRIDEHRAVVTNLAGEHLVLQIAELEQIILGDGDTGSDLFRQLEARHFVVRGSGWAARQLLATKFRSKHASLLAGPGLHLFVTTLRCDHSCPYCQVSRVSDDKLAFDMSEANASRSIDLALATPCPMVKIEFQGGESLLNFDLVRFVVEEATRRNQVARRNLSFVITTNLSQVTTDMLYFCRKHGIEISTSIDGPSDLHNANRPRPGGDAFERAIAGIGLARSILGRDAVSALPTTTRRSLGRSRDIVDTYLGLGFEGVFLRWLSPFGFAVRSQSALGYPVEEWNRFYETGLRYILDLNRRGVAFREYYASLILRRLLTPFDTGYVDLASPSGFATGAMVYNYDGFVYGSDEARMLAETGNVSFRLGHVESLSADDLYGGSRLASLLAGTMVEAIPGCTDCAFKRVCGTDPVFHVATQGDPVGHRPTSFFCARNMFAMKLIVKVLEDEPENRRILEGWV